MASVASPTLVRQLGSLFAVGSAAGLSDRELLERFATRRDEGGEAAFAALVARHGSMVLGVCRQLLGNGHDAEDAFQAVFLVLADKARSLREPELLGNWLYGVALRTARRARARLDRRRQIEERGASRRQEARPAVQAEQTIEQEQAEALHREIDRLPRAFRLPVVLCYFEGLSPDEAARRLKWPSGTLRSRLVRARDKLRRGLTRRGFALSSTALAGMLAPRSASASVSSLLCETTTRAAIAFAARHAAAGGALSASAAAQAQEVLRNMFVNKVRSVSLTVLALAAIATGAGFLTRSLAMKEGPMRDPAAPVAKVAPREAERPRPQAAPEPATAGRMTVTGRVLRPDNKPAAGVPVDITATPRIPMVGPDVRHDPFVVLGQGVSDSDGRFRIEAARSSSARFSGVYAIAGAAGPGTAYGCVDLHPDAEQPTAEVHLQPEQVLRGKLVDINGRPAVGVAVQLDSAFGSSAVPGARFDSPLLGDSSLLSAWPEGHRAWPKAVTTDAQGRFVFTGIGRGLDLWLSVHDPRFAQHRYVVEGRDRDAGKEASLALHPSTVIEGRVLAADTGRPIPDAAIAVQASFGLFGARFTTTFRADAQGRFRVNPSAGDYFRLQAIAPKGQPYLPGEAEFAWTKAAVKKEIDLTVPLGVRLHGKVTEQGTGRPVAAAAVRLIGMRQPGRPINGDATTREDGSFQLAAAPGQSVLLVVGPTLDYIPQEIAGAKLNLGRRSGGLRHYAHDIVAYEIPAGAASHEINPTLRPGKTLRGRVAGPTGETVEDAVILTRNQIDPVNHRWLGHNPIHARDGRFELAGFDPEKAAPAYFLDPEHEWGAAVELSGKQAGEELTIRLQPCGRAKARFVGPDGKPAAKLNVWPYFHLLMTPGAPQTMMATEGEQLTADQAFLPNIDYKHYPNGPRTDTEGRVVLPDLIPGAPYRVSDWSSVNVPDKGVQLRKDFTVKPGETVDLGDILVEKPGE
jgi:RNA polymerase sigma factor (sigma-70 family)